MKFTGERMIPEYNAKDKIYLEHVNRYIFAKQFVRDKDVIDIACGSGYGTELLKNAGSKSVLGIDISQEAIDFCRDKYPQINFSCGSVEKIPSNDKSIDVVVSFETIEHVDENAQEKFVQEVSRVLKDDGIFVLSTPNALAYEKGNRFHIKELTPKELENLLEKNGFEYELSFQESIDSNYILSKFEIDQHIERDACPAIFENITKRSCWEARYLIVVCTKKKNTNKISGSFYISNIKSIRHSNSENISSAIIAKDNEILKLKNEIQKKNQEIKVMKSSKFWKIREYYLRLRKFF